jgi:hypothetical protein
MAADRTSESTVTDAAPHQGPKALSWWRPGNLLLALLRRLLYLVVRARVTPDDIGTLGIDPAKPLCYVLQDRHL